MLYSDVVKVIFSYLERNDIIQFTSVCMEWYQFRNIFFEKYVIDMDYFNEYMLREQIYPQLSKRIGEFMKKLLHVKNAKCCNIPNIRSIILHDDCQSSKLFSMNTGNTFGPSVDLLIFKIASTIGPIFFPYIPKFSDVHFGLFHPNIFLP
jgi:hypothetical protein